MEANEPEKKMPSTAAKATIRSPEGNKWQNKLLTTDSEGVSLLCDLQHDGL